MTGAAYEHLFELGRGGMGSAHLARAIGAEGFERLVVIKRLLPHLMEHPDAIRRFLGEAKVAAALHHANIVGVQHSGLDDQGYYIVYDYVEGAALDELVDRVELRMKQLPIPVMLRVALDALNGLHAAHTARDHAGAPLGILHRDISPENLLVGRDGVTRVLDFGIAKSAIASVTTDQNYLVGKLMFMAPEYLARGPVSPALDVYALGVSLWAALTGESPWPGASEAQLVTAITQAGLPPVSSKRQVPAAIDELIARATARDQSERFADALAMIEAIEALDRSTGWLATHRDVAALVEEHCGVDLERRRGRISQASRAAGATLQDPPENAPLVVGATTNRGSLTSDVGNEQIPRETQRREPTAPLPLVQPRREQAEAAVIPLDRSRWWLGALVFSVIALGASGALWFGRDTSAAAEPTLEASAQPVAATASGQAAAPLETVPPADAPAASVLVGSPATPPTVSPPPPPAPTMTSLPSATGRPPPPHATPVGASGGEPVINKKNPYRQR
ncbi:MAG: serine/threonine-protein kinase [Polyangiaceae bacterium]